MSTYFHIIIVANKDRENVNKRTTLFTCRYPAVSVIRAELDLLKAMYLKIETKWIWGEKSEGEGKWVAASLSGKTLHKLMGQGINKIHRHDP